MKVDQSIFGAKRKFTNAEKKTYAREDLIYNVTEDLLVIMENLEISKKDLAYKLGKSKSYVTQILSGARNMTLGSLSDICFALNIEPKIIVDSTSCVKSTSNNFYGWADDEIDKKDPKITLKRNTLKVIKSSEIPPTWKTKRAA